MTQLQRILIVLGSAVGFQLASALAQVGAGDLMDWRRWLLGLAVGCLNALGIAAVALKTAGGLSMAPNPRDEF